MATNKVPSLCKQPDCVKLIFCYGEEFITDLIISTDLGRLCDSDTKKIVKVPVDKNSNASLGNL